MRERERNRAGRWGVRWGRNSQTSRGRGAGGARERKERKQ